MDHTPFSHAASRLSDPTQQGSEKQSGPEHAMRAPSTLPPVVEKMSSASPVRLQTSSRLKRSFERVKAQVDVDLLHFRRDLVVLLGSTTDEEGTSVLRSVVGMVDTCLEQDLATFKASCQDMVDELEELRRRCSEPAHRARITRLLFIITRCSRLVFTEEANSGGRHHLYMTQPRGRLQQGRRHHTEIPSAGLGSSSLDLGATPAASIRRSTTMPQRWLTDIRRPFVAAPDTDRPMHRPVEDPFHIDSTPSLSSAGRDFKPSPLGRSVVTALEAELEKAARLSTLGRQSYPSAVHPSSPGAQHSVHKAQKGPSAERKQGKLRWSPNTIAEAESPSRNASPGSMSSAPASPATPRPPAMTALQPQQPGDSSPAPSLPSTPKAAPAAVLQHATQPYMTGSPQTAGSWRAHSQPLDAHSLAPATGSDEERVTCEPIGQASATPRPASAQVPRGRMEGAPQVTELQTAQKNRPRALTFPLPHQRHLEPSRLSPQTPLSSAPGSAVKGSVSSLAPEYGSPGSRSSSSQALDSPMRGNAVCRICDEVVPAGTVQDHTLICKELDRAVNAMDSLNERLQRLADFCEASSRDEQSPTHRALLLRLAHQCMSAALLPTDGASSSGRSCQEALEQCKAMKRSDDAKEHIAVFACTQRALGLLSSKVAQLSCAASPQPSGEMLHMAGMHHTDVGIEDFEVLKPISRGAFGRVYLARKRSTGDLYAIKVMRKKDLIRKNLVENACFEKEIMSSANNPLIVRSFYSFTSKENLYIVMEWISGGDTASLLKSMGALDEDVARQYIAETILALEWCHSQGIIHRDIKPDNLLISAEGHIKAADFGLSCVGIIDRADHLSSDVSIMDSDSAPSTPRSQSLSAAASPLRAAPFEAAPRLRFSDDGARRQHWGHSASDAGHRRSSSEATRGRERPLLGLSPVKTGPTAMLTAPSSEQKRAMGTPDYLAPEVLLGTGHGSEVDWWSLGVVLYEFVTGCPPFNADSPEEIFDNILNRRLEWPEGGLSPECRDLIDQLLQTDPDMRLGHSGSHALKEHPWFGGLDWDNLARAKAAFVPQLDCESDTSYFDAKEVSLQSIIMDIGPSRDRSEPGSPASMSADFTAAPPAFNPAAFLGAGSSVSSTEHAGQAPQGNSYAEAGRPASARQELNPSTWSSMAESSASVGQHEQWLPGESNRSDRELPDPEHFLNFSFKNLELLGRKNQEMASSFRALQEEFGREDPYKQT